MTTFRTDVSVTPSNSPITLKNPILTAGSCFADVIGQQLFKNKFKVLVNPFCAIYNPVSIHKALQYAITNESAADHTYLSSQGVHLNYDFHSELSALQKSELVSRLNNTLGSAHHFLKDTSVILITYGTAWVYTRKDTGEVVANCHKIPSDHFEKRLLKENDIVESFQSFYSALKKFNPGIRIILTLSPVRHIKDTLELNSVSKAIVRTACHTIATGFNSVEYFPAYEIMMDDLRDYRFYKSDMIHPTQDAEEYIWSKFGERYFDENTQNFIKLWNSILAALAHKPFHPFSVAHQQFLKETLKRLEDLKTKINVEQEIAAIKEQLPDQN